MPCVLLNKKNKANVYNRDIDVMMRLIVIKNEFN